MYARVRLFVRAFSKNVLLLRALLVRVRFVYFVRFRDGPFFAIAHVYRYVPNYSDVRSFRIDNYT